jgi:hypothetical protein
MDYRCVINAFADGLRCEFGGAHRKEDSLSRERFESTQGIADQIRIPAACLVRGCP